MRKVLAFIIIVVVGFGIQLQTAAAQPLVDVTWLKARLGQAETVVLDLRGSRQQYLQGHIPGAVFTDYAKDGWREKNAAGIEGMLPPPEKVGSLIGGLGIDNATHVVLVAEGRSAADMGTATRIYWTFKVMGHDRVSILDGGYWAWTADVDQAKKPVNRVETTDVRPTAKAFKVTLRKEMLVDKADVQKAMAAKTPLIDNRPTDFYMGLMRSPAAKSAGTLPGAQSIPESWLTVNNGGYFRSKAQLAAIYKTANVSTTGEQISFCNTGHWASLGWFVSSEILGNTAAKMYDGSMAEWTADPSLPVEQKIKAE
ncbi:MAG: sulfurtransferase [Hyphomicrobiaceae bacterium]